MQGFLRPSGTGKAFAIGLPVGRLDSSLNANVRRCYSASETPSAYPRNCLRVPEIETRQAFVFWGPWVKKLGPRKPTIDALACITRRGVLGLAPTLVTRCLLKSQPVYIPHLTGNSAEAPGDPLLTEFGTKDHIAIP